MSGSLPKIIRRSAPQITAEEAALIQYLISLHTLRPASAKGGLQRLCAHYEGGRRLPISGPVTRDTIRDLVIRLFWSTDTLVRRWSYKGARWVGRADDAHALKERMSSEDDGENLTWAMAALISLANKADVDAHNLSGRIDVTPAMRLASRLFVKPTELILVDPVPLVSVNTDDHMLLKWAALLEGYGQAPDPLFVGNHPTISSLEDLTLHPDHEVAEYSVWARWRGEGYSLANLGITLDRIQTLPGNVKRWAYRLLTKDPAAVVAHLELIQEIAETERDPKAREGLALGIRNLSLVELEPLILDWYEEVPEEDVRYPLLEHMAANADRSGDYENEAARVFQEARGDQPLRNRLLAASEGTALHRRLRAIDTRENFGTAVAEYVRTEKGLFMNTVNIYGSGNSIGSISGDVFNSSVSAVASMKDVRINEQKFLEDVLKFINDADIRPSEKVEVATAVKKVASDPSAENKKSLIASLQALATTSSSIVAVVEGVHKLCEVGSAIFGV